MALKLLHWFRQKIPPQFDLQIKIRLFLQILNKQKLFHFQTKHFNTLQCFRIVKYVKTGGPTKWALFLNDF